MDVMRQIEMLGSQLSHYDGGGGGMSLYTGEGDPELDFGQGLESYAGENPSDRVIQLSLDNNNTSDSVRFYIYKGYETVTVQPLDVVTSVAAGVGTVTRIHVPQLAKGVMRDGFTPDLDNVGTSSANGLTCRSVGYGSKIGDLLTYLEEHPTFISGFDISSDNPSQLGLSFIVQKVSPFSSTTSTVIRPSDYTNQDTFRDKNVKIMGQNIPLDNDTSIIYHLAAGANVLLTLYLGAGHSRSLGMQAKTKVARKNIARIAGR